MFDRYPYTMTILSVTFRPLNLYYIMYDGEVFLFLHFHCHGVSIQRYIYQRLYYLYASQQRYASISSTMLRRKTKYEIYFHIQQYSTTIYHYGKDFCHFFLFPDAYSVYLHHSPYP